LRRDIRQGRWGGDPDQTDSRRRDQPAKAEPAIARRPAPIRHYGCGCAPSASAITGPSCPRAICGGVGPRRLRNAHSSFSILRLSSCVSFQGIHVPRAPKVSPTPFARLRSGFRYRFDPYIQMVAIFGFASRLCGAAQRACRAVWHVSSASCKAIFAGRGGAQAAPSALSPRVGGFGDILERTPRAAFAQTVGGTGWPLVFIYTWSPSPRPSPPVGAIFHRRISASLGHVFGLLPRCPTYERRDQLIARSHCKRTTPRRPGACPAHTHRLRALACPVCPSAFRKLSSISIEPEVASCGRAIQARPKACLIRLQPASPSSDLSVLQCVCRACRARFARFDRHGRRGFP